jgi:hypothetical protein
MAIDMDAWMDDIMEYFKLQQAVPGAFSSQK